MGRFILTSKVRHRHIINKAGDEEKENKIEPFALKKSLLPVLELGKGFRLWP